VKPCVFIAGGGTGGHVFPGLSVADAMRKLADVDVVFVGTKRGLESKVVPARGYELELLHVEPMKGGGPARMVRGGLVAAKASASALALVRRRKPRAVLSVGGYAAGPVSLAAAAVRVPVCVLEPNSITGLANKWLSPFCARAYVAFEEAARDFSEAKVRRFGVPLRAEFTPSPYAPSESARLLVLGGSQGARAINERMPDAAKRLLEKVPALEIVHQTGADEVARTEAGYERVGFSRVRVVPFIDDIQKEITSADVVVSRAGAVTLAEICAIGRASVLVPFPHAADDHQATNARSVADEGAAIFIRQEAADDVRLALELGLLFTDADRRRVMAERALERGKPSASLDVARDVLGLAGVSIS
jgi:UDP-N-acetylglucosamine--N-acetylmuramyl-(pentapeptide) pyrophosphoryl-undecaprenol N-acetylglucosamine transferase